MIKSRAINHLIFTTKDTHTLARSDPQRGGGQLPAGRGVSGGPNGSEHFVLKIFTEKMAFLRIKHNF